MSEIKLDEDKLKLKQKKRKRKKEKKHPNITQNDNKQLIYFSSFLIPTNQSILIDIDETAFTTFIDELLAILVIYHWVILIFIILDMVLLFEDVLLVLYFL